MKLHEFQAKSLLKNHGLEVLKSKVCYNLQDVFNSFQDLSFPLVLKAQVHAGGRGKAGGIKVAQNQQEALEYATNLFDLTIKNNQTGSLGQRVSCLLLEEAAKIIKEYYISILVDRSSKSICLISSIEGGMDIEEISKKHPEKIAKIFINKSFGLMPYQMRNLCQKIYLPLELRPQFLKIAQSLYNAFIEYDASLIEINPLALLENNRIIALDAKMTLDDNALYRHKDLALLRDKSQEDPKEVLAFDNNLSYVSLEGNIGCMVNGAGLAMATMDTIKHVGGKPANFLDVGGSATKERVSQALKIMTSDHNVKAIFINVFGGIVKCDLIAQGVISAAESLNLKLPLVVRLEGTNVEEGKKILFQSQSFLNIHPASSMLDGAKKAVELAK